MFGKFRVTGRAVCYRRVAYLVHTHTNRIGLQPLISLVQTSSLLMRILHGHGISCGCAQRTPVAVSPLSVERDPAPLSHTTPQQPASRHTPLTPLRPRPRPHHLWAVRHPPRRPREAPRDRGDSWVAARVHTPLFPFSVCNLRSLLTLE